MDERKRLYAASFVGASISYIFNVIAFSGEFDVFEWTVFVVLFFIVTFGFEKFTAWAETLENG
jgi:hypothetical protein